MVRLVTTTNKFSIDKTITILICKLNKILRKHKVDGSRIYTVSNKKAISLAIAYYNVTKNKMFFSHRFGVKYGNNQKKLCKILSHEFLHMLLNIEFGYKAGEGLDNILKFYNKYDDVKMSNGGI